MQHADLLQVQTENKDSAKTCDQCGAELPAQDFRGVTTAAGELPATATTDPDQDAPDGAQQEFPSESCPSCGQRADPGSSFCGACGKSLTGDGEAESAAESKRSWMTGVVEVKVRPRPDLTTDDLIELLKERFGRGHEIYKTPGWRGRDIMIRRSATVGVAVDMKHTQTATSFHVGGTLPSDVVAFLFRASFGLAILTFGLWIILLRLVLPTGEWKEMEGDVSEFLRKDSGLQ